MFKWFGKVNFTPSTKVSDFARPLRDGRLMGSRCKRCGATAFPPRADCHACLSGDFEFVEVSGKGTLVTYTKIVAAPTGFEDLAPYMIGVVELDEGVRMMVPLQNITVDSAKLGMRLRVCWQKLSDEITYPAFEPDV